MLLLFKPATNSLREQSCFKNMKWLLHESHSIYTAILSPLASPDQLGLCAKGQGLDGGGMDETDVTLT